MRALDLSSAVGLLALQRLPRVGPATALRAARDESFGAALTAQVDRTWLERALTEAEEVVAVHLSDGVRAISFFDRGYPERLRGIPDPPPVLFVRGNAELLSRRSLAAVVGTREPTSFGASAAQALTATLTAAGYGIVSGLAKGIDTIAHREAVRTGAPTIAVMGGGLDRVYPAENKGLAAEIVDAGGALVAEQPFGTRPQRNHLVARDRIQSGLSVAVVVGQCAVSSGTMHTVRYAAAQSRPVFAPVPHISNDASEGLRVLLETPASELWQRVPAWKRARALCAQLGAAPLARGVQRAALDAFVASVEQSAHASPPDRDRGTLLTPLDASPPTS